MEVDHSPPHADFETDSGISLSPLDESFSLLLEDFGPAFCFLPVFPLDVDFDMLLEAFVVDFATGCFVVGLFDGDFDGCIVSCGTGVGCFVIGFGVGPRDAGIGVGCSVTGFGV